MSPPPPPGWMDGFTPDPPPRPRRPPPPAPAPTAFPDQSATPAAWAPGQDTVQRPVICCPACGSDDVAPRDNARHDQITRWACARCANAWKRPRGRTHPCHAAD